MSASGTGKLSEQRVEGLGREAAGRAAKIVKEIGIVGSLGESGLEAGDRVGIFFDFNLSDAQGSVFLSAGDAKAN